MAVINWRDFAVVTDQLAHARESFRDALFRADQCPIAGILDKREVESPIEAVFVIWLEFLFMYVGQVGNAAFMARAQQWVEVDGERFRPDFILVPSEPLIAALGEAVGQAMKIAVELDGHEFHERTKEQVTLRDRRDRVLQRHGWVVLHISGSELVRTNVEALEDVWLCANEQLGRLREAIAKEWGAPLKYRK